MDEVLGVNVLDATDLGRTEGDSEEKEKRDNKALLA
jgi:hypothetical protein